MFAYYNPSLLSRLTRGPATIQTKSPPPPPHPHRISAFVGACRSFWVISSVQTVFPATHSLFLLMLVGLLAKHMHPSNMITMFCGCSDMQNILLLVIVARLNVQILLKPSASLSLLEAPLIPFIRKAPVTTANLLAPLL